MQRQSISASEYTAILAELVTTSTADNVMSVILGTHSTFGRVVLLRSGTDHVIIADRLEAFREHPDDNYVLRAVTSWAEAAHKASLSQTPPQIALDEHRWQGTL